VTLEPRPEEEIFEDLPEMIAGEVVIAD